MKVADHQRDGDEIDDDEYQDVRQYHPGVAHRERGLHELGRDPAGEFILIEAQRLRQHVAVEIPAQPHGEIAGERLLLEQALQPDQQDAAGKNGGQQQQMGALLGSTIGTAATLASQSTTRPSTLNNSASNTPIRAVNSVIAAI